MHMVRMMHKNPSQIVPPPWRKALPRLAVKFAAIGILAWLIHIAFTQTYAWISTLDATAQATAMVWLISLSLLAYAILIAIPFVPAIEIGLTLMMLQGPSLAPFLYVATVFGLFLAFLIGQRIPLDWLRGFFRDLHMIRACAMLDRMKALPPQDRLIMLADRLPKWLAPLVTRYRYVTIGLVLSVPGNVAIGGGGGIMMTAGISRLFQAPLVFVTLLIAVAPVPLVVWGFGIDVFG